MYEIQLYTVFDITHTDIGPSWLHYTIKIGTYTLYMYQEYSHIG